MGQENEGTRAAEARLHGPWHWERSAPDTCIPVPLLRDLVAALMGHQSIWKFIQDLPGQELPQCPASPSTLLRGSPGSGPSVQDFRSSHMALQWGVLWKRRLARQGGCKKKGKGWRSISNILFFKNSQLKPQWLCLSVGKRHNLCASG